MSRDSSAGFFAGLIIGALIGAAVGLLYAPQSGEETRRVVKEKVYVAKDAVVKAAGRAKDAVSSKINPETGS
ncbi:MAG: YtxH domain-containing protein [Chloroflexi bacterium]|nr:YtxH domain-containing protein [Chloroflexota bacterium]